jgi:hypothetical protein
VADLVSDRGADLAIVHRIVGVGIEIRRLQNAGRKDDLVEIEIVIGVVGRWRHAPFGAIDGTIDAAKLPIPLENIGVLDAADQIGAIDG